MAQRLLQLDDVRHIDSPQNVASLFQKIGYNASAQQLAIDDLELPTRSAEAIWNAYMIADHQHGNESLQVLLFQLQENEWLSNSVASNRMRSLAQSLCRRPSNFLLLGTKNYDQLMLVNPRKTFDADLNLKVSIRKLLIDRANPTNYDRDRLDAIAARNLSPQELYKVQCEAFDVEKLTKEFYRGYREIFEELQRVIKANNQHSYFTDSNRLHQFSQRLLGRIMFLYFLQKKEFLAGDRNFLKTQYNKLRSDLEDTDFYNQVLEPLFFEMLNKQRPNMDSPWGKIPYLNGGLFDRDYGSGVIDAAGVETPPQIELPNSVFDPSGDKGILRFFNSYNFTVSENIQGDEDAAVDPEMLGKVFENMLASEERGQSGTFYTPRGIVQFMCVENPDIWLLFVPWHFPLHEDSSIEGASAKAEKEFKKQYPAIYEHLLKFKTKLLERNQAETGIRYEWYALQRCAATYWQEFTKNKILYQEIATYQAFAWDNSGTYSNNKTFLIPDTNLYLLSLLNSKVIWFFLKNIISKLQGGAYAMQTTYVSQIPIPNAPEPDRLAIEALVQKCLDAKGQSVEEWEAEIDDRVAHLYGLTAEEMKIIRGK
ncbi:MAG: TaqI-like C-terminal specificity domain-containing protein [Nostoc sp.]|uniref:TaqI-like C-terminal specificity domain-containing protein n=1 Tax=Nostoc sp. TaxID=1180 RepID=UPI002FFBB761